MATELDRRVAALESESVAQAVRNQRPFADWSDAQLDAEVQRLESGRPLSDEALARYAMSQEGSKHDNA